MKRVFGIICIILGVAVLAGAATLFIRNSNEDKQAGINAQTVLDKLTPQVGLQQAPPQFDISAEGDSSVEYVPILPDPYDPTMREVEVDGNCYIGYITIESLGLELPVMSSWSYSQLKIAPCRFHGSTKTDDLVVMAHNYSRHFGNIGKLNMGDSVYFTDMDGIVSAYTVAELETLQPTAVENMNASGYDLTLFTCNYSGEARVTVRCTKQK